MLDKLLIGLLRLLTGASARSKGFAFEPERQRIFYANHSSHLDTLLLWSQIPGDQRPRVHPAAAKDYWWSSPFKTYLAENVFRAVPVIRKREGSGEDPLAVLHDVLNKGESLIIFPEGTRGHAEEPAPFKAGLYNLAQKFPHVVLVPAWINNVQRVMPKGEVVPVPVLCSVTFGAPLRLEPGEERRSFLDRARNAVVALRDI